MVKQLAKHHKILRIAYNVFQVTLLLLASFGAIKAVSASHDAQTAAHEATIATHRANHAIILNRLFIHHLCSNQQRGLRNLNKVNRGIEKLVHFSIADASQASPAQINSFKQLTDKYFGSVHPIRKCD